MFKYTALIIEPRQHNAFRYVMMNFLENLSDEWGFLVFHGNKNQEFVYDIVYGLDECYKKRIIHLINLGVENLDKESYSSLFYSRAFYDFIPTDTFLVFQTDSIILKENKDLIHDYVEYDYVGAPWGIGRYGGGLVGNGGFSLRKKNKMLEIMNSKEFLSHENEDVFFSMNVDSSIQYNVPSFDVAKAFSVETVFCENPFGVHNFWKYLCEEENEYLIHKYPELRELIELNAQP